MATRRADPAEVLLGTLRGQRREQSLDRSSSCHTHPRGAATRGSVGGSIVSSTQATKSSGPSAANGDGGSGSPSWLAFSGTSTYIRRMRASISSAVGHPRTVDARGGVVPGGAESGAVLVTDLRQAQVVAEPAPRRSSLAESSSACSGSTRRSGTSAAGSPRRRRRRSWPGSRACTGSTSRPRSPDRGGVEREQRRDQLGPRSPTPCARRAGRRRAPPACTTSRGTATPPPRRRRTRDANGPAARSCAGVGWRLSSGSGFCRQPWDEHSPCSPASSTTSCSGAKTSVSGPNARTAGAPWSATMRTRYGVGPRRPRRQAACRRGGRR